MLTGIIKFFVEAKSYGFIRPHDGGKDIFFYRDALDGLTTIKEGQWVTFDLYPFEFFPREKPRAARVALCAKRGEYDRKNVIPFTEDRIV